jgi:S-methylmethionine-dependent homocysteine/selenocysteine methylase
MASTTGNSSNAAVYRRGLPQLDSDVFLTDGGLETTLIFDDRLELPDFAAFLLLGDPTGRAALTRYFDAYARIAARDGVGIALETPTWRANRDWGARHGYDDERLVAVNQDAVALLLDIRTRHETSRAPIVISGCIGPRGDGYVVDNVMSADQAREYHSLQAEAFAQSAADLVTAITMTYTDEAIGVVNAARDAQMPVVISFTVETDGRLPSGESLADAITAVDAATDASVAYFMINCAHPTHFADMLASDGPWHRLGGIRANASTMSHAELDEAEELDAGDPADLAERYRDLHTSLPNVRVLGGCCGTSHVHVEAISEACRVKS